MPSPANQLGAANGTTAREHGLVINNAIGVTSSMLHASNRGQSLSWKVVLYHCQRVGTN